MSCSSAQCQAMNLNPQGQAEIASVLTHNATANDILTGNFNAQAPSPGGNVQLMGPYATKAQIPAATAPITPIMPQSQPAAMTLDNLQYLNAALRTQIGRRVLISFLIGTNTFVDKSGMLLAVGANYLIIREAETDDLLFCDFFTIKFVKVYE